MNRKQFILSLGASCSNWNWSWSFVNHEEQFVVFGYSEKDSVGNQLKIFSDDWKFGHDGKKKRAYSQAITHIGLIQDEGYQLKVFKLEYETILNKTGYRVERIKSFEKVLHDKNLVKIGPDWFAIEYENKYEQIAEFIENNEEFVEGATSRISVNAYERNEKARSACVKFHGYKCLICGFDFEQKYGELGRGYIHVHHIIPISKIKETYSINPKTDLIPICANCHAMIHRKKETLKVVDLKEKINNLNI